MSAELITEAKSSIKLEKTVVQHTPDDKLLSNSFIISKHYIHSNQLILKQLRQNRVLHKMKQKYSSV